MNTNKMVTVTTRMNIETRDVNRQYFEESGTNSYGEFQQLLLDTYAKSKLIQPEVQKEIVTVEKALNPDQLLLTLSPVQFFALYKTVTGQIDFAERQNNIIDSLKRSKPFFYSGNLYDPEFRNVWIRNMVITKTMTDEEREKAIRFNMVAFLINIFMVNLIDENLDSSVVKPEHLKTFIQKSMLVKPSEKEELKQNQDDTQPINIT